MTMCRLCRGEGFAVSHTCENSLNLKALYPVLWKMAVFSDIFLV